MKRKIMVLSLAMLFAQGCATSGEFLKTNEPDGRIYRLFSDPPDTERVKYSTFPKVELRSLAQKPEPDAKGLRVFCGKQSSIVGLPGYPEKVWGTEEKQQMGRLVSLCPHLLPLLPYYGVSLPLLVDGKKFILHFQTSVAPYLKREVTKDAPVILYYYHLWYNDFSDTHEMLVIEFHSPHIE